MSEYHTSVLLEESVDSLNIKSDGIYVDVTFGAGGHSEMIINKLGAKGCLYAFDQDNDAIDNQFDDNRLILLEANFRYIRKYLRLEGVNEVDGILADLGVSSHQLDFPERGFSYRFDAPLDMRMNVNSDFKASDLLSTYDEESLLNVLSQYGEVRNSKSLAKSIVNSRKISELKTTFDLNRLLDQNVIGPRMKYFSQVYQAIRMEVNDEIGALKDLLTEGASILKLGGRFSVITFHSIEDRYVKNFFKTGNFDGIVEKDEFGNIFKPFKLINKKVIVAGKKEQKENARSRSAKLRIIEKF